MANEKVSMPGCNDSSIYLACFKVQVNLKAVSDNTITEVILPRGTIAYRSGVCDDGNRIGRGYGCAHFTNDDKTASIYLSYPLDDRTTRR